MMQRGEDAITNRYEYFNAHESCSRDNSIVTDKTSPEVKSLAQKLVADRGRLQHAIMRIDSLQVTVAA